jgi:hypothetical protein
MAHMPSPTRESTPRRRTTLGAALGILLVVPTVLGFAVADAGESRPPTAAEDAAGPVGTRLLSEQDQADLVSNAPLANAPSSASDALTRQGEGALEIPRITFVSDDTGAIRVENGGTVALADGYAVKVTVDPFPPASFAIDVTLELSKDGEPLTDATVDTVWDMTVMAHGPFDTTFDPLGSGTFETSFDFFMFGPWYVDTTVTTPGAEPVDFRLSIYVWPA